MAVRPRKPPSSRSAVISATSPSRGATGRTSGRPFYRSAQPPIWATTSTSKPRAAMRRGGRLERLDDTLKRDAANCRIVPARTMHDFCVVPVFPKDSPEGANEWLG
jgi:hypothetical protein